MVRPGASAAQRPFRGPALRRGAAVGQCRHETETPPRRPVRPRAPRAHRGGPRRRARAAGLRHLEFQWANTGSPAKLERRMLDLYDPMSPVNVWNVF
jgi:hypothetical protein